MNYVVYNIPTPVFLPGESQGWRSLAGCSPWGRTESDTTEATYQQPVYNIHGKHKLVYSLIQNKLVGIKKKILLNTSNVG